MSLANAVLKNSKRNARKSGQVCAACGLWIAMLSSVSMAAIPASEREALIEFWNATNGGGWERGDNWLGAVGTECTWYGIACDLAQAHVVQIALNGNHLSGSIPDLSRLPRLSWFDVYDNALSGPIPAVQELHNLRYFYVGQNQLTGSIPDLSGLTALQYANFRLNRLSGSLPSLSGLSNLEGFFAGGNELTGTIPDLSGLSNLTYFYVEDNALSGLIPPLTGLTSLRVFRVNSNNLSGNIPEIAELTHLASFLVGYNQFTGPVPAVPQPNNLETYGSSLCPNPLDSSPSVNDDAWNVATGFTPWWSEGGGRCDVLFQDGFGN